ncbi:neuropeptide B [Meleagris gallopavo]|uniref:Neuropeptide B n=1 Tax=Meleagris gallopavo TaxID=9103 RepID=A0A803XT58_MELGA|nr:neuropeptide B [Meleagris gallopavo]
MRAARCLALAVAVALLCRPAAPWYRQAAAPLSYPVGRASGLLSGLRRLPYSRRSDSEGAAQRRPAALRPGLAAPLHAAVPCVTGVDPELRSCRLLLGVPGALQCRAAVTVSLVSTECVGA